MPACSSSRCCSCSPSPPRAPRSICQPTRASPPSSTLSQKPTARTSAASGRDAKGAIVLRWGSAEFPYDDGRQKTFDQMLEAPDIKDTFSQIYPLENPVGKIPENFDPGRVRVEELSKAMYGASEAEVAQSCVPVDFCGTKVRFNARCGAAAALAAVAQELQQVFEKKPALREYATTSAAPSPGAPSRAPPGSAITALATPST